MPTPLVRFSEASVDGWGRLYLTQCEDLTANLGHGNHSVHGVWAILGRVDGELWRNGTDL
jgi:hypothetical protein